MRHLSLLLLAMSTTLFAADPAPPAYPLWDNHESVADYAKRVNLPPTKTLDLGNGVKMELVLIPAGKFIMGTPEPQAFATLGYGMNVNFSRMLFAGCALPLLVILAFVLIRAIRNKRRPQLSLGELLMLTIAAGVCLWSGMYWRGSILALEAAEREDAAARARFRTAPHDEMPAHPVTITQPFYMGKFSVTQEQYEKLIALNLSQFKGRDNPVEMISWNDAHEFCEKLTEQTKQTVRMPTEAEWEYACRAGTTTAYHSGDEESDFARVAWYAPNSKNTMHPVGQKEANDFGLYDMHGNVSQWCQDKWDANYYSNSPIEDPQGPAQGYLRVFRGSAWNSSAVSSAVRWSNDPNYRVSTFGFRVVVVGDWFKTP